MSYAQRRTVDDAFSVQPNALLAAEMVVNENDIAPSALPSASYESASEVAAVVNTVCRPSPTAVSDNDQTSQPDASFVVFIGSGRPERSWLNTSAPGGYDYLPRDVTEYLPRARIWVWGFAFAFDDANPASLTAKNFLFKYSDQRQRDRRHNPGSSIYEPKLILISSGNGGIIAKKILLEGLSSHGTRQEIALSCIGIVFLETFHLPLPNDLKSAANVTRLYPKSLQRTFLDFNLIAVIRELEKVNLEFLNNIRYMPSTFSVVNRQKILGAPDVTNGLFPPEVRGENRDQYISIIQTERFWTRKLHKQHPVFITIMNQLRDWTRESGSSIAPLANTNSISIAQQAVGSVNLLSIDGGGVRGLASLLVLERIMREIARLEIAAEPATINKIRIPADYFQLAGGTSTGGLICIMLFRLRMDIQSAIAEYRRLSPEIFHRSATRYIGSDIAKAAIGMPWFRAEPLEAGVKRIISERISWQEREQLGSNTADALLISPIATSLENSCKTFLCALKKGDNTAVRFRAYPTQGSGSDAFQQCRIWEAARATSAAPFYFPTAEVAGVKFWDGGLANNNPVLEVLGEKSRMFPGMSINCLISLGTGFSERKPTKSILPVLGKGKRILGNVTNVHINDARAAEQTATPNAADRYYFRFNPSTSEDEIGLADHKMLDALTAHTARYLDRENVRSDVQRCAELLYHRRNIDDTSSPAVDASPEGNHDTEQSSASEHGEASGTRARATDGQTITADAASEGPQSTGINARATEQDAVRDEGDLYGSD
ncbi:hypothetical protein LTR84_003044 [Exophiala bonariae]|uniref:PNPLA domain-containing protein n=1 Tax=Exophiala bonariae TaxID=1690606 RepID=A0AAV9N9X4_9EURO|nr:hypothetical protein LTR84_003044 [Exophiala bonariae]